MTDSKNEPQLIPKKMIEHYSYCLHEQIGKGFSSKVFKGKNEKSSEIVAIKVIDMKMVTNEIEKGLINQEINALKQMNSPNILKLHDYYFTQNNTYIITEYCNQGDLATIIRKCGNIPEVESLKILKHIISGFKEQIRKGIIHRDIKPANIFLKNGIPKIADYGFSKMVNAPKDKIYYSVGTPLYMCPQTINNNNYSEKTDIWSIGILYYELLYGQVPWQAPTEKELYDRMVNTPPQFHAHIPVSEESKDFILRALQPEEEKRISLKEIDAHPVFLRRNTTTTMVKPKALPSNTFSDVGSSNNITYDNKSQNRSLSNNKNQKLGFDTSPERGYTTYGQKPVVPQEEKPKEVTVTQQHRSNNSINKAPSAMNPNAIISGFSGSSGISGTTNSVCSTNPGPTITPPSYATNQIIESKNPLLAKLSTIIQHNLLNKKDSQLPLSSNPFQENEDTINQQLNLCKYLFRVVQLIDHFGILQTPCLKQKLMFLAMKNIMIKMTKMKLFCDKGTNILKLSSFVSFMQSGGFSAFIPQINESQKKYSDHFQRLWNELMNNRLLREELQFDRKMEGILDQNFNETEQFYENLSFSLKAAIRELNHILRLNLASTQLQELSTNLEAGIILLDYLVFYLQLCALQTECFDSPQNFAKQARLQAIADGRPASHLTKQHYQEIRNKIYNLKI